MRATRHEVSKALRGMEALWGPPRSRVHETALTVGAERAGVTRESRTHVKNSTTPIRRQYTADCQKQAAVQLFGLGLITHGTLANWFRAHPEWRAA